MPQRRTVKSPAVRADEIVAAARDLFAAQGVHATTFQQIADRVGVTRGLVYHYVGTMPALVDMVVDACVEDFVQGLREWDAARVPGDIDQAVSGWIVLFRTHLPGAPHPDPVPGHAVPHADDAGLSVRYVDRSVDALLGVLQETTIPAYAARHEIEITHVTETFAMLLHGLIGLLRTRPEVSDQILAHLTRQTLRLATTTPVSPDGLPLA